MPRGGWSGQDYDPGETATRFGTLVARLEGDFATRCRGEPDTQDSSEYGRATVPGEVTVNGALQGTSGAHEGQKCR